MNYWVHLKNSLFQYWADLATDTQVYSGDLSSLSAGPLFEVKTQLKENFAR